MSWFQRRSRSPKRQEPRPILPLDGHLADELLGIGFCLTQHGPDDLLDQHDAYTARAYEAKT